MNKSEIYLLTIFTLFFTTFGFLTSFYQYASRWQFRLHMKIDDDQYEFSRHLLDISTCVGSLISIFVLGKISIKNEFGILAFIASCVFALYPFCTNYKFYNILNFLFGFCRAPLYLLPNLFVIDHFRDTSFVSTLIHSMYIPLSFGEVISANATFELLQNDKGNLTKFYEDDFLFKTVLISNIYKPFVILSVILLIVSAFIAGHKPKKNENGEDQFDSKKVERTIFGKEIRPVDQHDSIYEREKNYVSKNYALTFLILASLVAAINYVVQENFKETLFIHLSSSSSDKNILLDNNLGFLDIQRIIAISVVISRFINTFLSKHLDSKTMIIIHLISIAVGNLILMAFKQIILIYIGIFIVQFGFANLLPLMIHLVEERIKITTVKICILFFINSIFYALRDQFYEPFNAKKNLFQINIGFTTVSAILFSMLMFKEKKRLSKRNFIA